MIDLEDWYPGLSKFVSENGQSLAAMAKTPPPPAGKYLQLSGNCYRVANGWFRHGAPDAHNYIATFDEFDGKLADLRARRSFWEKLTGGVPSALFDALGEPAWLLKFWGMDESRFPMTRSYPAARTPTTQMWVCCLMVAGSSGLTS